MIVTAKLRHALDLLTALGHHDPAEPLSLREVAETSVASEKYLEAVAAELRRAGLLVSKKGKSGGYFLGRPAREISLLQIVDACEPELFLGPQGALLEGGGPASGPRAGAPGGTAATAVSATSSAAPLEGQQRLWAEVAGRMRSVLAEYHLSDLVQGRFSQAQVLNYVI
jgi:Rrf2 family protein